jgi:uncharacterized protein (TIGR00725 family)
MVVKSSPTPENSVTGPMKRSGVEKRLQISIIGGASCDEPTAAKAEEVGLLLAQAGAVLVCGGRTGVMEAACRGAEKAGGTSVGILMGYDDAEANPHVDIRIPTGLGVARNAIVVASGRAVIAIDGYYGTLSEIALALKIGRPVVTLGSWLLPPPPGGKQTADPLHHAHSPAEAVEMALRLARPSPEVA